MIGSVHETAELLKSVDNVLILTHRRPDGDTTGSASALCIALRAMGKTAYIAKNPDITARYECFIAPYYPSDDWTAETIVSVDCADEGMVLAEDAELANKVDIAIDHHGSNKGFAKHNLVIPKCAACAEIICAVIEELGIQLDEDMARGIYVGVSTDTGCFKYTNTTANTHMVAAKCIATGLDSGSICRELFEIKSRSRFELEKHISNTMEFYHDGKIAVVVISDATKKAIGANWDDMDSIAGLTREIEGVEIGMTFTELENGNTKLSVRTTEEADAAAICVQMGGGGHIRAAGATIAMPREQAVKYAVGIAERVYSGEETSI